jgi:hypothetical protein
LALGSVGQRDSEARPRHADSGTIAGAI